MAERLIIQTGYYTASGYTPEDPDVSGANYLVSAITRPRGGGATIQSIGVGSWTRLAAGEFWAPITSGLYTDDTWYEYVTSWTKDGIPMTSDARPFWNPASGVDLTVIGPATIGVLSVTDATITVSHTPPVTPKYSYTQFKAIPINGGTVVTTTGTGASVTIPGLAAGTKYVVVATPYSVAGVAGEVGVASVVTTETLQAAVPDLPLIVEHYFDGASVPQITEMIDAEGVGDFRLGGGGAAVGNCILYRQRLVCLAPVERLEVRCLSLLVGTRQLNQQVGGVRSPRGYNP